MEGISIRKELKELLKAYLLYTDECFSDEVLHDLEIPAGKTLPADLSPYHTIIHWGNICTTEEYPKRLFVFNNKEAIVSANNKALMERTLNIHGLRTRRTRGSTHSIINTIMSWKILVFHLESISIKRGSMVYPIHRESRQQRRILREAVKAVYVLGLELAEVELIFDGFDRSIILNVNISPKLNYTQSMMLAEAIQRYNMQMEKEMNVQEKRLYGADCEFILIKPEGRVVSASRFLEKKGRVGCDGFRIRGIGLVFPLVELRPAPAENAQRLFQHLRKTMKDAVVQINQPELMWRAGGMPIRGLALGGHLHVSGVRLSSELLRVFDNYLALIVMTLESESCKNRRPLYGVLGDFRKKSHGGFEYRSLPSWLASPADTFGIIALFILITTEYRHLHLRPLQNLELQSAYYRGDKLFVLKIVRSIWEDLYGLSRFSEMRSVLYPLMKHSLSLKSWNIEQDLREGWKVKATSALSSSSSDAPIML